MSSHRIRALVLTAKALAFCVGLVVLLAAVNGIFRPSVGTLNGWAASQSVEGQVDVVVLGSSRAYCTVLPMELWREEGITAVDVTSAIQIIPVTAAYLEEVLDEQSPKVVMVELYMVGKRNTFDTTTAHQALDYMPVGWPKVRTVLQYAEPDSWFELLFPLRLYHSRWSQLTRFDYQREKDAAYAYGRGAMYLPDAAPLDVPLQASPITEDAYLEDLPFIRQMAGLCAERDAQLILFESPTPYRLTVNGQSLPDRLRADLGAEFTNVTYIDMNVAAAESGVDPSTDYKDDLHVNHRGAVKVTRWLAQRLVRDYGLADRRSEELAGKWDADLATADEVFKADW